MKQWLITNKLEFEEISILENTLLKKDILRILSLTGCLTSRGRNLRISSSL